MQLSKEERDRGGMWDMDTKVPSTITSHEAGYLNKELESIVGVQTDKPFKRSMQPFVAFVWQKQLAKRMVMT